jgi:hypothetical protein
VSCERPVASSYCAPVEGNMASGRSFVLSGVVLLIVACGALASGPAFAQTALTTPEWRPGMPVWIVKNGPDRERVLRKEDLGYYEERRTGVVEARFVPPSLNWAWPLGPGKTWTQTYTREHPLDRTTNKVTASSQAQSDRLTVPAGTFDAIKATCRNVKSGRTFADRWYVPAVKAMARNAIYLPNAYTEELIRHNIPQ